MLLALVIPLMPTHLFRDRAPRGRGGWTVDHHEKANPFVKLYQVINRVNILFPSRARLYAVVYPP